jgi:hypothetical protein
LIVDLLKFYGARLCDSLKSTESNSLAVKGLPPSWNTREKRVLEWGYKPIMLCILVLSADENALGPKSDELVF